jgi:hypothetical protein
MRRAFDFLPLAGLALLMAWPVHGFAADPLGVNGEEQAHLTGKVVDILCELAHDCAPNCGDGKRQLALKTTDNKLYFASKSHVIFAGSTNDLIQYCGKEIIVDGLVSSAYASKLLFIQQFKTSENGEWIDATKFRADWAKAHGVEPNSDTAKQWYKTDTTVRDAVALHGKLGLAP